MRNFTILFFLILFSSAVFAQKRRLIKKPVNSPKYASTQKPSADSEKEEFEQSAAQTDAAARVDALKKFAADFPNSAEKNHALELIVAARAQIADEKLRAGDAAGGVALFKLALKDAPTPVSDKLFTDIILQIPNSLFFRGQRADAVETARIIEEKVAGDAKQLLGLATFYLGVENADEAKRLADKALALEPNLPAVYQTLGLVNRLNFNLEEAANAYSKALELDANSVVSKRSLAEMKRALGKSDEAIALYREILAKEAGDAAAQNGLILSLFDADKKAEAEAEMAKSLAQNPNNLPLLVGAAYWYAAHDGGAKAVEMAQKAVAVEPRYIWSYIALARGFSQQNRYADAERTLLAARAYGNFPTLDYELASARLAAGFYREAAQELTKNFTVKDDSVTTKLGGRIEKQSNNFIDLLALERQASIFEPFAADNPENSQKLKSLLDFYQKLESSETSDAEIADAADKFVAGHDKMKLHRQLFAADRLLEKNKALPKVTELMKSAVGGVDAALDIPSPAAAVLADELFESRSIANAKNEIIIVPDVSRQTLSYILRGRIEEIGGWALFQENKPSEAVIRLKRAVSVLPEKSAWWHSSMWRLGAALQTDGKPAEALDAYIKGYTNDAPNAAKRIIIESLYQQVNGSLAGLDAKIGVKPAPSASDFPTQAAQTETAASQATEKQNSSVNPASKTKETPTIAAVKPTPETVSTAKNLNRTEPTPDAAPKTVEPKIEPTPQVRSARATNAEAKTVTKRVETARNPAVENNSENSGKSNKPLFEPVIITVPKVENPIKPKPDTQAGIKPADNAETRTDEIAATEKPASETVKPDNLKPQVIADNSKTETVETPRCEITASQESISLLNNGGNLGILLGFEGDASDVKEIIASSSNPRDIEVVFEPEIGALSKRAFFIVKSISAKKGIYNVTFEAPCGRKKVLVKVR